MALYATEDLAIRCGASVEAAQGLPSTVSGGRTVLGAGAQAGNVWSADDVSVRPGATVAGSLTTGGRLRRWWGSEIGGPIAEHAYVPPHALDWTVSFPDAGEDLLVRRGEEVTIDPGSYRHVTVERGGRLLLRSGVFYLEDLRVRRGAELVLDQEEGSVVVYVRSAFAFWGSTAVLQDEHPDLLVGYFGSRSAVLGAPFQGAFIAPNAKLFLGPDGEGECGWMGEAHEWPRDRDRRNLPHLHLPHGHDGDHGWRCEHHCRAEDDEDFGHGHHPWNGDDRFAPAGQCGHHSTQTIPYEGVFFAQRITVLPHVEVLLQPFATLHGASPPAGMPWAAAPGEDVAGEGQAGASGEGNDSSNGSGNSNADCALHGRPAHGSAQWLLGMLGLAILRRRWRRTPGGKSASTPIPDRHREAIPPQSAINPKA